MDPSFSRHVSLSEPLIIPLQIFSRCRVHGFCEHTIPFMSFPANCCIFITETKFRNSANTHTHPLDKTFQLQQSSHFTVSNLWKCFRPYFVKPFQSIPALSAYHIILENDFQTFGFSLCPSLSHTSIVHAISSLGRSLYAALFYHWTAKLFVSVFKIFTWRYPFHNPFRHPSCTIRFFVPPSPTATLQTPHLHSFFVPKI